LSAVANPVAEPAARPSFWQRLPVVVRAVITGLAIALPAANVIPVLAGLVGLSSAACGAIAGGVGAIFLMAYLWWTRGGGPPRSTKSSRRLASRAGRFSRAQWRAALPAALAFAIAMHAAMVILFRLVPFPVELFRRGYDFSAIHGLPLKWLAIVLAAASAAITEETGFRGYMQQPIESRHGVVPAIFVSTAFFWLAHLNQSWAIPAMMPIGILAGLFLALLAWSAGSLIPGMIAHTLMDIGLFAYWWTGTAGTFHARTIAETGIDAPFEAACLIFIAAITGLLFAMRRLWKLRDTGEAV